MVKISTPDAPRPGGHYSQAVAGGGFVFVSGQLPLDPASGKIEGSTVEEQTLRALRNMEAVLRAADCGKDDVLKVTVYIPDIAKWSAVNAVYASFFGDHRPARSVVPTRELHFGALIEIEAVAWKAGGS
jgi:2-iminobutanoate/2-iminopropanoate deaminase